MLVNGKWSEAWNPYQAQDSAGRFLRQGSSFRNRPEADDIKRAVNSVSSGETRYHLYAGYICPWASRALIARTLFGLEPFISLSIVDPRITENGWQFQDFPGSSPAAGERIRYIHQLYTRSQPDFSGRATIPVLWDKQEGRIINNESADLLRLFNEDFRVFHHSRIDLYPVDWRTEINGLNELIYQGLNNGVYKAGFAKTQEAYEEAVTMVFETLNLLEQKLSSQNFLVGNRLTECDIRLFVTLVRFDVAYYSLFKANQRQLRDYTNLSAYLDRLLDIPAFSGNTRTDHIKAGYYSIKALNPGGIVPAGPQLPWIDKLTLLHSKV